jgi:hypothetical protein
VTTAAMSALIVLPRTVEGRDLLRNTLRSIRSAETRLFVATEFDWDGSAEEDRRLGFAPDQPSRRGAR